ncbi:hypothetical protein BCR43DRAFT_493645 [Syncephalastrum racemosum]|uniref:Uncharacterized protein n=1 Tax=Syncephalastrum racemosum TaxID=13706 RepID=A0A1X2HAW0_SYNRA|nr:hypothetical protein BCR43DRAFT_493645 [Syncephalastrum racemosum]
MALVLEAIALVLIFVSVTRPGHLEQALTSSHAHYISGKTFPGAALSLILCLLQHFVHVCIVAAVAAYEDGLALYKGQSITPKDSPPCVAVPLTTALPASMPAPELDEETNKAIVQGTTEKEETTTQNTKCDESHISSSTIDQSNRSSAPADVKQENQLLPPLPESDDASLIGTDHTDPPDDAVDDTPLTSAAGSVHGHDEKEDTVGKEGPGAEDATPVTRQPEIQAPCPINQDKRSEESSINASDTDSTGATSAHTTSDKPKAVSPSKSDTLATPPSSAASAKDLNSNVPYEHEQTQPIPPPLAATQPAAAADGRKDEGNAETRPSSDMTTPLQTVAKEVHAPHVPEAYQDKQKTPSVADERTASPSPPAKSSRLLSKLRSNHQDDTVSLASQTTSTHEPQPTVTPSQSLSRVKGKLFRSGTLLGKKKSNASIVDMHQQQEQPPTGAPRPSHSISLRFKNSKKRLSSLFH